MAATTDVITTPFDATSTAAEVIAGVDLTGKRAVVTGAASGIGIETARALASAGAEVTLAVRNTVAGQQFAADIGGSTAVAPLELSDPASVAAFVRAWQGPLDILVNNAGVMALQDRQLSVAGHEMQFATNHLGHFALANGLHASLAAADGARVVSVSSSGHLRSPVVFDDVDYRFRDYDPFGAYGQSKTANVLFAVGVSQRWADDGITANALMPGGIMTALQRHLGREFQQGADERFRRAGSRLKTPEQGAATSVLLAASPHVAGVSGRYFEDCREAAVVDHRDEFGITGVASYALDPDNAERLWDLSLRWTT
ncbi:SDR family NAD(P)-dependent oxidoreductase [Mycolicibacterium sp. 018/SC-01/001]|uniref:SDR family NAD(P)-dependent oxidoreductase n=1 Tax=Mycolicibacterium sp. 018/SC-01/001 TaxID=2592069 RepID=UPI00117C2BFC|nr:SDR family NAD(P)-dependent oxidoreductase [Mycolicibacterium sp. 018/SC-01/001]TRW82086.1 SDR family NAD(P)-dependent oxidoreductase [Mycolicibacterium sp. 018/SC-01/001]